MDGVYIIEVNLTKIFELLGLQDLPFQILPIEIKESG
jgi:hypothetical protein